MQVHLVVQDVNCSTLGEEAETRVGDLLSQLLKSLFAVLAQLVVAEQHEPRLHALGQYMLLDSVVDQAPRQIEFADRTSRPVDYFGRQHASYGQFLAEAEQEDVNTRGIDVGQFRQIAHAHHHFRWWIPAADLAIAVQRCGKTETDGLQDWINSKRHAQARQALDDMIESLQSFGDIGNSYHFATPIAR